MHQRVGRIVVPEFPGEPFGGFAVPDRLGREGQLVCGGSDVVLPEADDADAGGSKSRIDWADGGEDRDGVSPRPQPQRRVESDFRLPSIDVGVIENQDDTHDGSRSFRKKPIIFTGRQLIARKPGDDPGRDTPGDRGALTCMS